MGRELNLNELFREADAVLLTSEVSRRYYSGCDISEGMALLSPKGLVYMTDSRYIEAAERGMPGFRVIQIERQHGYAYHMSEIIRGWNVETLGYEEESVTAGELRRLEDALEVGFLPMQAEISAARIVKTDRELDCVRTAQEITDKTFSDILNVITAGMTEKELKTELIYRLYKNGGEGLSFDPIVVSGPNTSMPHGVAGDRILCKGDFVTLDFGCKWGGYCSDMTRTVALGCVTDEMQHVYETVLQAQEAGIAATKAGVAGRDVDAAARNVIERAGYGAYFGHGYGHGVGLEVHEAPNCSPSWDRPLPAGCVCSAEPGIYLPGKFGIRIEDLVIVAENTCENITKSPKSLIIL